jgi:hypothetical protein
MPSNTAALIFSLQKDGMNGLFEASRLSMQTMKMSSTPRACKSIVTLSEKDDRVDSRQWPILPGFHERPHLIRYTWNGDTGGAKQDDGSGSTPA